MENANLTVAIKVLNCELHRKEKQILEAEQAIAKSNATIHELQEYGEYFSGAEAKIKANKQAVEEQLLTVRTNIASLELALSILRAYHQK